MLKLIPTTHPKGCVLLGISRPETLVGITRIAVLLSHYYNALPLAVHVAGGEKPQDILSSYTDLEGKRLFDLTRAEANKLGYPIRTYTEFAPGITEGIRQTAQREQPFVIVLGHPLSNRHPDLIADSLSLACKWPVILAKLADSFEFDRILVPLSNPDEITSLQPILYTLSLVGPQQITLLDLKSSEILSKDWENPKIDFKKAADPLLFQGQIEYKTASKGSPLDSILEDAKEHDLVVMKADYLAEKVAQYLTLPFILIRGELRSDEVTCLKIEN